MGEASEEITVRRGRRADAAALAALHHEHGWCYDEANVIVEYHDDAFEPDSVIVAEVGGELVGKIELFLGWKSSAGRFGIIRRFVIHPDWRGKGIGHRLLTATEDEARRAGCAFLELSVDEDNPGARRLYASIGFDEDRREIILRKPLDGQARPSDTQGRIVD